MSFTEKTELLGINRVSIQRKEFIRQPQHELPVTAHKYNENLS
jgi:hypothetical protein